MSADSIASERVSLPSAPPGAPIYLDCAATTPVDPRVWAAMAPHALGETANAGSSQHDYGRRARQAVERARDQVARAAGAARGEVIFTSGATESNNLAILGLAAWGEETGRRHVVSTAIEHRAVLEPLRELERRGFDVTLVPPTPGGWVDPTRVRSAVRPDTLLVSVMHVNNETGAIQPIAAIAAALADHDAYLHVDAAQGFGLLAPELHRRRIDLISISGHKFHAPQGIGALIARRRDGRRPPLAPLMHGGGQELGLRPGTLPVPLIVGLGEAVRLAVAEREERLARCRELGRWLREGLAPLRPRYHGDPDRTAPHLLCLSFPGLDAETVIEAWADLVAVSHGAACTTALAACSHVLAAMGVDEETAAGAIRLSWCHRTPRPDVVALVRAIRQTTP